MPTIGNNAHTFLHGLSDFWVRFYADANELEAFYHGTEIMLAQTYLDMLSSFLNISVAETPLFNTEFFKLVLVREDQLIYDQAINPVFDRYVLAMPDDLVVARILQNKVIEPTASLEQDQGYDLDSENYTFRFRADPSGQPLQVLGTTSEGHLLTYGTGALTRFYVTGTDTMLANAKVGNWVRIGNSGSGNDQTYRIGGIVDTQAVLLQGSFTLPEANDGDLYCTLLDSEFAPMPGFAHRSVGVGVAGSFDDPTRRQTILEGGSLEIGSWYAAAPLGLGVRKGDIVRVYDQDAVSTVPSDFRVAVVRHDKLYLHADDTVPDTLSSVADYVVLREPSNTEISGAVLLFTQQNNDRSGVLGSIVYDGGLSETVFTLDAATPVGDQFQASDKSRYITLSTGGPLSFTGSLSNDGTLTRTGGAIGNPFARAVVTGQIRISGSSYGQDGTYTIESIASETQAQITATGFVPETGLVMELTWLESGNYVGVQNIGTYKIKKFHNSLKVTLDLPTCYDDPQNGALTWALHDGYIAQMSHNYIVDGSVKVYAGAGDAYTGGLHDVVEGVDYAVNNREGRIVQTGRLAGTWGLITAPRCDFSWLRVVLLAGTTGVFDATTTEVQVTEVAMWAPDAQVDKFHLYENYGYLIDRFQPSSEAYREFIRGIFQLYILGPTLGRVESALNVVVNMPVIRDDGEVLSEYDNTSDSDSDFIRTVRPDGTDAEYVYPKGTLIRDDIAAWVEGDPDITFESFEPVTALFAVVDYINDPTWWESIVIPRQLMPTEGVTRRTTVPVLYENILGALDDPRIGDPGLFIGADDEGFVPANIASFPAKRRKMANVVMNVFLKYHMFFVRVDPIIYTLLEDTFIHDVLELVLIAKPSYNYVYIEPASAFLDTMVFQEDDIEIQPKAQLDDIFLLGNSGLTISSFSWNIGDVWRYNPSMPAEALTVTDPATAPGYTSLTYQNVLALHIHESGSPSGLIEWEDYWVDYKAGRVYPLVVWPAGTYTAEYPSVTLSAAASKDASLGDTDIIVGGQDPVQVRHRHNPVRGSTLTNVGGLCSLLTATASAFDETLHVGQKIFIYEPTPRVVTVRRVVSSTKVDLEEADVVASVGDVTWDFGGEEHLDGACTAPDVFKSATAVFRERDLNRYIQITGSAGGANDGYHRIKEVVSLGHVKLDFVLTPETDVKWRTEGSPQHMDLVERPLQITVTP